MEADDGQQEIAGTSSLSQALRRVLLEDESLCDMVFVCAGGVDEVPARRRPVAMRSPFFENLLLKWDTPGGPSKRVRLPEIESAVMRICLEFFYTDTVQLSSWPDGSILLPMKVIAASDFFLVGTLQEFPIHFLLDTTKWMCYRHGNEDDICARLARVPGLLQEIVFAFNLGVLLDQTRSCKELQLVLKRLGRVIDIGLLSFNRLDYHKHISRDAMLHLLESQTISWGDASVWEYGRLQHIVHSCMYEVLRNNDHLVADEAAIQDIVNRALPWHYKGSIGETALSKSPFDEPLDCVTQEVINALVFSVQNIFSMVRVYLEDIPSIILSKFIEPLALVPTSTMESVQNLQAVGRWRNLRWDEDSDNEGKEVGINVIEFSCNSDYFFGVSPCNLCAEFREATTLTWDIRILKPCKIYRVGFGLARPRRERFDGNNNGFWSLCSFGVLLYDGKTRHCKRCCSEESWVRVSIDLHRKVCSFLIDGKDIVATCNNLPLNGQVYPAIYMSKPGSVRVSFLCGSSTQDAHCL